MKQQPLADCMPVPIWKDNRWDAINSVQSPVPRNPTLHDIDDDIDDNINRRRLEELLMPLRQKSITSSSSSYQHSTTAASVDKTDENTPFTQRGKKPSTKLVGILASPISHGSSTRCTAGEGLSGKEPPIKSSGALPRPPLAGPESDKKKDKNRMHPIISLDDYMTKERSLRGKNLNQWFQYSDSSRSEDDSAEGTHGTSMIPVIHDYDSACTP